MATIRQQLAATIRELHAQKAKLTGRLKEVDEQIDRHEAAFALLTGHQPQKGSPKPNGRKAKGGGTVRPVSAETLGRDQRILDAIRDHGQHMGADPITNKRIGAVTGLNKQAVSEGTRRLEAQGLIEAGRAPYGRHNERAWLPTSKQGDAQAGPDGGRTRRYAPGAREVTGQPEKRAESVEELRRKADPGAIMAVARAMRAAPNRTMPQKAMKQVLLDAGYANTARSTYVLGYLAKRGLIEKMDGRYVYRLKDEADNALGFKTVTIRPGEGIVEPRR